jgi:orc1/cdc6 family replication initiation protein
MLTRSGRGAIFADARVFDTEWVPSDFHSRDPQLNTMAKALEPLLDEDPVSGLFLYGPSGTGKTSSSLYLLDQLHQHMFDLETASVNCWTDHTRYGVFYRIADEIGHLTPSQHERSSTALRDAIESVDEPIVVLLDEADQLDEPEILYDLYEESGLEVILTANSREDVTFGLDDRLQSRLRTFVQVEFRPYSESALVPILEQRVKHGLQPGIIDDGLVALIARESNGDARDAIAALKGAAQAAVEDSADEIRAEHVHDALETASFDVQRETLARLNQHQSAVYDIVFESGPINPGEIFDRYADRMDDPRTKRTVRKYLRKLVEYELISADGNAQNREYAVLPGAPAPD